MQHNEIIHTLEKLIPAGTKEGPTNVLLKYASDNNLAPAQLERLGQMYNVAMTLNFMDKSANRGATFEVIDVPDLLSKFTDPVVKKEANVPAEWAGWFEDSNMQKAASTFKVADSAEDFISLARGEKEQDVVWDVEYEEYAPVMSEGFWDSLAKEAMDRFELDSVNQMIADGEEDFRKAADKIEDMIRSGGDFEEMVTEAVSADEGCLKAACALHSYLTARGYVKSAFDVGAKVRMIKDTYNSLQYFKKAAECLDLIQAAKDYKDFYTKESAAGAPPKEQTNRKRRKKAPKGGAPDEGNQEETNRNRNKNKRRNAPRDPENNFGAGPEGAGDIGAKPLSPAMFTHLKTPPPKDKQDKENKGESSEDIMSLLNDAGTGLTGVTDIDTYAGGLDEDNVFSKRLKGLAPKSNKTQEGVDSAVAGEESVTTLQRLMLSDPIISKADPQTVVELANTVNKAAPQIGSDPNLLRMVLREALQYDAIPLHTFKDLVDVSGKSEQRDKDRNTNQKNKYEI